MKAQEAAERLALEEANKLSNDADLSRNLKKNDKIDVESLTNAELIGIIADAVEQSSDARTKQLQKGFIDQFEKINSQVGLTQQAIIKMATSMDVQNVKTKNPELNVYENEAAKIMQENPRMSVSDAFLLAKARKVETSVSREDVDRERPDNTLTRSAEDKVADVMERRNLQREQNAAIDRKTTKRGVVGFRNLVEAGIDAVQSRRASQT